MPPPKKAVSSCDNDNANSEEFESVHVPSIDVEDLDFDCMFHDQNVSDYTSFNKQFTEQLNASELLYPGASVTMFHAVSMLISWFALILELARQLLAGFSIYCTPTFFLGEIFYQNNIKKHIIL